MMKNLGQMMKQAQQMQSKMGEMQERLDAMELTGSAGGGAVCVTLSGKGEMRGVKIDPAAVDPADLGLLEDLIVAAHSDARARVDEVKEAEVREMTGGLPLPPGMKLPF